MSLYGRDDQDWDHLVRVGRDFLIERARLRRVTSYTELNATLVRRTGMMGFDFDHPDERAAMGHLLGLIVERDFPTTGLMLSALVHYLDVNNAGPGFYHLATQLGLLPPNASARQKEQFWIQQVNAVHNHYARPEA
jgi:hypothetical protein